MKLEDRLDLVEKKVEILLKHYKVPIEYLVEYHTFGGICTSVFDTLEEAQSFAERRGYTHSTIEEVIKGLYD